MKEAWEARRVPRFADAVTTYPIEANPEDTPRQLRIKGDILADQEEALRGNIGEVEDRIHSLQQEMRIRRKVRELASEMELFNEWEEQLTHTSVSDWARVYSEGNDPVAVPPIDRGDAFALDAGAYRVHETPRGGGGQYSAHVVPRGRDGLFTAHVLPRGGGGQYTLRVVPLGGGGQY